LRLTKVSSTARDLGVSRFAVYDWVKREVIPPEAVIPFGAGFRLDADLIDALIAEGKLKRQRAPRGREKSIVVRRIAKKSHAGRTMDARSLLRRARVISLWRRSRSGWGDLI
jgi:hypothetical protein